MSIFKNEFKLGSKFFGGDLFECRKSFREIYKELSDNDKALFKAVISQKRLTVLAQQELMCEAYQEIKENGNISDRVKEILLNDCFQSISAIAFEKLAIYKTDKTYGDLVSIGYQGALHSLDNWLKKDEIKIAKDCLKGKEVFASFNTFATNYIKWYMQDAIEKEAEVDINYTAKRNLSILSKTKADFLMKFGRIPTNEELAEYSNANIKQIKMFNYFLSFVTPKGIDEEELIKDMKKEIAIEYNLKFDNKGLNSFQRNEIFRLLKEILTVKEYVVYVNRICYDMKWCEISTMLDSGNSYESVRKAFEDASKKIEKNREKFRELL